MKYLVCYKSQEEYKLSFFKMKIHLIVTLFALQALIVKLHIISLPSDKSIRKIAFEEPKSINSLRVAFIEFEPFVYEDERGQFYKGIEFELIKTIAKKEHLSLLFEIQPLRFDQASLR